MINKAYYILKNTFGYKEFRPLQKEIITNVINLNDTLVIMPTGGGKSLCYQIPAMIFEGITVVISPLISLMKDQVEQLRELNIGAVALNSALSYNEYQESISSIINNKIKLIYLAPETLMMPKTLKLLSAVRLSCLTIDEAHCISEWGHDFRPEYRQIIKIREEFPKTVCIALTATATPRVQNDIIDSLRLESSSKFIASFNRKNLYLQIDQKLKPLRQALNFIRKFPNQSGIIYCLTRKQADDLTHTLTREGYSVKPYHAGLSDEDRNRNQEEFIHDNVQIMVATIAFGMGINKPNIRFILHYDLPKNIESYYQQIGRAGRDGLNAHCLLLFSYGDIYKVRYFIMQKEGEEKRVSERHLNEMISFVETDQCRRVPLLKYFGEEYSEKRCNICDNCIAEKTVATDITILAQKFLSCVIRTGEVFGIVHIIDVLRGSTVQKVMKFNHHELSTYGIGKEYSKEQWLLLCRQFIQYGLLVQDMHYNSLKLTPKAWEILKGKERISGRIKERSISLSKKEKTEANYDITLFEDLRKKRKELADNAKIPSYMIFPDKTLIEMATYFPQTRDNLLDMYGVGTVKYEKYGQLFLNYISAYCSSNEIKEKPKY